MFSEKFEYFADLRIFLSIDDEFTMFRNYVRELPKQYINILKSLKSSKFFQDTMHANLQTFFEKG